MALATLTAPLGAALAAAAMDGALWRSWSMFAHTAEFAYVLLVPLMVLFILPILLILRRQGYASLAACALAGMVVLIVLGTCWMLVLRAYVGTGDDDYLDNSLSSTLSTIAICGLLGAAMGAVFQPIAFGRTR